MLTDVKEKIAKQINVFLGNLLDEKSIFHLLEAPKDWTHGHFSLPVFQFAKALKKAPPQIAQDLSQQLSQSNLMTFIE